MIIVFMATPSVTDPEVFLFALLGLLFLDMGWLAAMILGVRKGTRPEPQWTWLGLNIPSAAVVVIFLLMNILRPDILELTSTLSSIIIAIVFGSCAVYDIHKSASDWFGRPRHPELSNEQRKTYEKYMREAIKEAKKGLSENGIPIGAILLENATIIGRGYNRRVQDGNPMAHAEIECLKNTGRRQDYRGTTLFSTLMPCCLCAGAIIQFGVKEVVVGEARNFVGARNLLEASGVNVTDLDMDECFEMLSQYIRSNPNIWDEDIGKS